MVEGGRTPLANPDELHELGFDLTVTAAATGILAAHRAMAEAYGGCCAREGSLREHLERWPSSTTSPRRSTSIATYTTPEQRLHVAVTGRFDSQPANDVGLHLDAVEEIRHQRVSKAIIETRDWRQELA